MADLSPAARAVFDAWIAPARFSPPKEPGPAQQALAAALRAVVEHLGESHAGFDLADRYGLFVEADDILAIADELEGAQ